MISKCYLSPVAEEDIDEVITCLVQENSMAAHSFLDAMYDAMVKLEHNPDFSQRLEIIYVRNYCNG